ncbi:ABC transporter ATP-binding protein [Amnibacterium kyonggiense]|uniref:Peptide/nickel transport system ATP-binding protein n=1 Tax=Amnibacterium kyonggiense TaxID=595671 RepID=A0A4R7FR09_9MICO|nr:ATP-binding cassette domain-containing protein [Amnibacterium kyonggiense]TDS80242.1 peptide/nickel transport system ATP-binding protein [Amnibacterium kyonggiense]
MSLLSARGLTRDHRLPRRTLFEAPVVRHALRGVDLDVEQGETVAVIGESGSGKSTLARLLIGLDVPTAGTVTFDGRTVSGSDRALRPLRRDTGMVFQDPYSSLDPRMTVARIVGEPLRALRIPGDHRAMITAALEDVRLDAALAARYPHELSGGQRQRVAFARAIVHRPRLLVGDEPMSALDVTVRAQLLKLLARLRREFDLTVLLVSHDLGLVQHVADRLVVMREGRIVEQGSAERVLRDPQHPYTRELIAAVPRLP